MTRLTIGAFFVLAALLSMVPVFAQSAGSLLSLVTAEEPGTRLTIHGTVVDAKGTPIAGARVHVYQTDATGWYTRGRAMDEPHARLSGWITTDAQGRFELRSIRPGGYPKPLNLGGRERRIPAHIHMDLTAEGFAPRKLQAVFADDPLLDDAYWKDWVRRLHQPVLQVESAEGAATARLRIELDPAPARTP